MNDFSIIVTGFGHSFCTPLAKADAMTMATSFESDLVVLEDDMKVGAEQGSGGKTIAQLNSI